MPEATTNLLSDPQFGLADPDTAWTFAGDGTPDFTRVTTYQWTGTGCAQADLGGGSFAALVQALTVTATSYTLSARVRRAAGGVLTSTECRAHFNSAAVDWDSITLERDGWYLCVHTGAATAGSRDFGVRCKETSLLVDGVQLENKAYRTTYCDGEQDGCSWLGQRHASASQRRAQEWRGGKVVDLSTLGCEVTAWAGTGMPPVRANTQGQGLVPGRRYVNTMAKMRPLTLTLWASGASTSGLHLVRRLLLDVIKPDRLGAQDRPFLLRYSGAAVPKELACVYEAGLESGPWRGFTETIGLRLLACEPHWQEVGGEHAVVLDTSDVVSIKVMVARRYDEWELFGSPAATGAAVGYAMVVGLDGKVYLGGSFTDLDGIGAADYIAAWTPETAMWAALGTGMAGGTVRSLAVDALGGIWAGGAFTSAGGVANTAYIARWNGAAWTSVGVCNGFVRDILVGRNGWVWATGAFTSIGGVAANRIAYYDGSAWHALGTGLDDEGICLAEDDAGNIVVGGSFTSANSVACNYVAWLAYRPYYGDFVVEAMAGGLSGGCRAVAFGSDGSLYAGGVFTAYTNWSGGPVTVGFVARYFQWSWYRLGEAAPYGVDDTVAALAFDRSTNLLYAGGDFGYGSNGVRMDKVGAWNGSTWSNLGVTLLAGLSVERLYLDMEDNLYIGTDADAITWFGETAVTAAGSASAYPVASFERSGGTEATLYFLINVTTGRRATFKYSLQDGERLIIDMRPGAFRVWSSLFGDRMNAVEPGSDFCRFALQPGANVIGCYVYTAGSPTVTADLRWRNRYWSTD
jgi:hypothetical protein